MDFLKAICELKIMSWVIQAEIKLDKVSQNNTKQKLCFVLIVGSSTY